MSAPDTATFTVIIVALTVGALLVVGLVFAVYERIARRKAVRDA